MRVVRFAAAGLAWLFVAAIVLQVFLAGVGLFGAATMEQHMEFGYAIPLVSLVLLLVLAAARAGATIKPGLLLFALTVVQTMLPWFRIDAPLVAALHPVNALVLGFLGLVIARRATAFARADGRAAEAVAASQAA